MRDSLFSILVKSSLLAFSLIAAVTAFPSDSHAVTFNNISSVRPASATAKVTAISVAPTTPASSVFAGTDGGGIYTMSVGGTTWSPVNYQMTSRVLQSMVVHPAAPSVLLAGTKAGVFRSINGGSIWSDVNIGLGNTDIRALAIDPASTVLGSTTVFAGTAAGVYKSTDGGSSWSPFNDAGLTSSDVRTLIISGPDIYAGTADGIFRSATALAGWGTQALSPNTITALAAGTSNTLFAGTASGGVYSSIDGVSWNAASVGLSNLQVYSLAADSSGTNLYAGTAAGLFKKSYAAAWSDWAPKSSGITTPNTIRAIATAAGSRVYAGTDLGIFTSNDSATSWSALNNGLIAGRAIAVTPTDPTKLTAGLSAGGGYTSVNRGGTWAASVSGLSNSFVTALAFDPSTAGLVYAATGAGVFKSIDYGQNWTDITANLANRDARAVAVGPAVSPALHVGTAGGVFTWNGVNSWSTHSGGMTGNPHVTSLAFNGTSLLAGTDGGGIYRSIGGAAWTQLLTGLSSPTVTSLAVDSSGGYIYAGTSAGVHKSTIAGNGDNWARIANSTSDDIRSLAVNQTTPPAPAGSLSVLVAGTPVGAFSTTDAGATWASIPHKAMDSLINGVALDDDWPQHLHAATGNGLATTQLTPTLTVTPASGYLIDPAHINSAKVQQYTLTNSGTLDLTATGYAIAHTLAAPPTLTTGGPTPCANLPTGVTPLVLRPGQSCTLQFSFTPTVIGNSSVTITFASNDIAVPSRGVILNWNADDPLPISMITSPVNNASVKTPTQLVGVASDIGSGLQSVQVSLDGGASWIAATQTVPGSWSSWQYNWTPLSDGAYSVESKAFDGNNAQSTLTMLTLYVDNTSPSSTVSSPANGAAVKGTTATVSGTAADPVTAGSGSGIQKIEVSTDGGATWLDATGTINWTFSWTLPSDGLYDILARATDKAGNIANSTNTNQIRVDNTAPTGVAITAPSAGLTLPVGTSYLITGTAADSGSGILTVEVSADNGISWQTANYNIADNTWNYPWTLPANGTYQLKARATDLAGNVTTTPGRSAVINNPLPTSLITSPLNGAQISGATATITLTAQVTVANITLAAVEVSLGGGAWSPATCSLVTAPGAIPANYSCSYVATPAPDSFNATYMIKARAVDSLGNIQTPTSDITVLLDNKLPTSTITSPANGAALQLGSYSISGTATDYEPLQGLGVKQVDLSFDNGITWLPVTGTTIWNFNWTPPADGTYTIKARATDQLNNLQTPLTSISVTIDSVAPVASFTVKPNNPSNSLNPAFTFGSTEPTDFSYVLRETAGNTLITSGNCSSIADPTPDNSCSKGFSIAGDGSYSLTVTPVDKAGNTGTTIAYSWLIDTTAVIAVSFSPVNNGTRVSTSGTVTVTFNKGINSATIETTSGANSFQLNNGIVGTVTYDPATFTATFTPDARAGKKPLDYGTTYTATLTPGIADLAGNSLQGAPVTWSFTTDPDGDINGDGHVTIVDALLALHLTVGRKTPGEVALLRPVGSQTAAAVISHGDVAPLSGGRPDPDGKLDVRDALVILGKSIRIRNW